LSKSGLAYRPILFLTRVFYLPQVGNILDELTRGIDLPAIDMLQSNH
jgi:hypothetical protein